MTHPIKRIWSVYYRDYAFEKLGPGYITSPVADLSDFYPKEGDLVLFLGGQDIDPSLYGADYVDIHGTKFPGRTARAHNYGLSPRDELEFRLGLAAIDKGVPLIGCCRGAQLLCILAGGSLIQHTTLHHGQHDLHLWDGRHLMCNSVHHQMMRPKSTEHRWLGWSHRRSTVYHHDEKVDGPFDPTVEFKLGEPEILYFPTIKGLAFQYHPESDIKSEYGQLALELVRKIHIERTME